MSRSVHKVFAGITTSYTVQLYNGATPAQKLTNVFDGSELLSATVWPGDSQASTFVPTIAWLSGPAGTLTVTYPLATTADITPGWYQGLAKLADGSSPLAVWDVEVLSTPGTTSADLITLPYFRAAISDVQLSDTQVEFLPWIISASSDAVRQYCNRWFTRRTLTREYEPNYDGRVLLPETPVNQVLRVATDREDALTIACSSSTNQIARAYFATSGDRVSGLTYTDLVLVRTASGATTTSTLSFSTYTTVQALADAVNLLSGGWSATVASGMGSWPVSELAGGDTAQGCLGDGAVFQVYGQDVADYGLDWETGMLYLGTTGIRSSLDSPRWGSGWDQFAPLRSVRGSRVLVTHDLGYDTVPAQVQRATAMAAKDAIRLNAIDSTLETEAIGNYSYKTARIIQAMSSETRQILGAYRISNA